jgi:hypothetical protein
MNKEKDKDVHIRFLGEDMAIIKREAAKDDRTCSGMVRFWALEKIKQIRAEEKKAVL